MRRRLRSEPIEKFREVDASRAAPLRERFESWIEDPALIPRLAEARPEIPDALDDRAQDAWEPLLAIADEAADLWPSIARSSADSLHGEAAAAAEERWEILALRHVREAFDEAEETELPTASILAALVARDDGPWAEKWGEDIRAGKGLVAARRLRNLLAPFEIHPVKIRTGATTPRGYRRADFADAWNRNVGENPWNFRNTRNNRNAAGQLRSGRSICSGTYRGSVIVDGVVVDRALAPDVLRLLAEGVRRDPSADSEELRRLRVELDLASARTSVVSVRSTSDDEPWLDTREVAARYGRDPRTIRRWAAVVAAGRSQRFREAVKEDGRWWIKI